MWYVSKITSPKRNFEERGAFIKRVSDALADRGCERLGDDPVACAFHVPLLRGDLWGRWSFLAFIDEIYLITEESSTFLIVRSSITFWFLTFVALALGFSLSVRWFPDADAWQTSFVAVSTALGVAFLAFYVNAVRARLFVRRLL